MEPPEREIERLDQAIAKLKDALWPYRFQRQQLQLKQLDAKRSALPDSYPAQLLAMAVR